MLELRVYGVSEHLGDATVLKERGRATREEGKFLPEDVPPGGGVRRPSIS